MMVWEIARGNCHAYCSVDINLFVGYIFHKITCSKGTGSFH